VVGIGAKTYGPGMSRVSKNDRVLLLIVLMAASSLGVGGAVYGITSGESAVLKAEGADLQKLRLNADDLSSSVYTQEAALDDYVLSGDRVARQRFDAAGDRAQGITTLVGAAEGLPHVRAAFARVDAAVDVWRDDVAGPVLAAVATNDRAAIELFRSQTSNDHLAIESALSALTAEMDAAAAEFAGREAAVAGTNLVGIAIAFGFVLMAFSVALVAVRRFGKALELDARQASVLNQFTELTSFANDDRQIAAANLVALGRLAGPDGSVTHILNRSMDRAVPESSTGDATAEILPLHALGRCAGVLRGTMYVNDDLSEELSVHCPIYPAGQGTLACIPLISGESVGAVHLHWRRAHALPLASRASIARITEHAALAIGNQRLLAALHGHAFDLTVEEALKARKPDETVSILMLDVDHFKEFNDKHGHPAGDEALRVFGGVLRSCLRDGDVAARYGGEEFAVLLRGPSHDPDVAATIAERIRARTETTIIPLSPGMTARITVSIGIASAPEEGLDRVALLQASDEALYRAKESGRNRIAGRSTPRLVGAAASQERPGTRDRKRASAGAVAD
jgi:diguanylate cyclase (GGDEF)-like protein